MTRTDTPEAMTTEPSSEAIESQPQGDERPSLLSRPRVVFVVWFVIGPAVLAIGGPLITPDDRPTPDDWLKFCLFGAGYVLWMFSCWGVYDLLFTMAEARWPAAATVRKVLSWLFAMARSHHHSD